MKLEDADQEDQARHQKCHTAALFTQVFLQVFTPTSEVQATVSHLFHFFLLEDLR